MIRFSGMNHTIFCCKIVLLRIIRRQQKNSEWSSFALIDDFTVVTSIKAASRQVHKKIVEMNRAIE